MALDPTTLRMRYPNFAAIGDDVLAYWIADAARFVDTSWPIVEDREPAQLAYAAHSMTLQNIGADGAQAAAAAGVQLWSSGSAELRFAPDAVTALVAGGLTSTRYGREFLALLERNKGGARVTGGGFVPGLNAGFNGFAGPDGSLLRGYPYA